MPFPAVKIENPGEFVISVITIAALLIKLLVELPEIVKKMWGWWKKEKPAPPVEIKELEEDVEVIYKKDFDKLIKEVQNASEIITKSKEAFSDTLGCIGVISVMFNIIKKYSTESTIAATETEIYAYLRHNEFTSKSVITAMFEQMIKETREERKVVKNGMDSRPSN